MAQKLILPINATRITAGYKNANYRREFGYTHYGLDLTDKNRSDKRVWGSGKGKVTHAGWHPSGGNVVVVVYENCQLVNRQVNDLAIRYFHLDSIAVKVGQAISKDTVIGMYGNTGASSGAHLHIEIDVDTKYPNYSPQTSKSNDVLKAGVDSTIKPTLALWCKTSAPDYQSVIGSTSSDCYTSADLKFEKTQTI